MTAAAAQPKKMTTTVTKTAEKGKVRSIRIEVAENGFTVTCDRERVKTAGKSSDMYDYMPAKPAVFETGEGALDYVREELGIKAAKGGKG